MKFGRKRKGDQPPGADGAAAPPLLDLTCALDASELAAGLEDWAWIGLEGKDPIFASHFGHVVFQAPDGVWWLDPNSGELSLEWPDQAAARAALATEAGQDEYLLGGLAIGAVRRGIARRPGQIYTFTPPPILGGGFDLDRVQVMDFVVGMSVMGQIIEQVRDLPPGTKITGFKLSD